MVTFGSNAEKNPLMIIRSRFISLVVFFVLTCLSINAQEKAKPNFPLFVTVLIMRLT